MSSTCLIILSILVIIAIVIMVFWLQNQFKAKNKTKVILGICSIVLLLIFELNLFVWSAKLSSCYLYFVNQYITATTEQEKYDLIDQFFPEFYDENQRKKVLKDFDNYLITKPLPVEQVAQITTTPVGPLIVRLDANGNIISEPNINIFYVVKFQIFSKQNYKIVEYQFY